MKKMLALAFVALMAGAAFAQPGLGMFFSDTEFTNENTTITPTIGVAFNAYLVAIDVTQVTNIGGYECGIQFDGTAPIISGISGTNGWTNFGDNLNHLVGYQTALPVTPEGTAVLCTFELLVLGADEVGIRFGAATPSSFDDIYPGIAEFTNPENLIACFCAGGETPAAPGEYGLVARINGDAVTPTEARSLSDVKALFD